MFWGFLRGVFESRVLVYVLEKEKYFSEVMEGVEEMRKGKGWGLEYSLFGRGLLNIYRCGYLVGELWEIV